MSTLTKAFVVLVTIMSVILVALVVPFVAQTENYAEQFKDKSTELNAAMARSETSLNKIAEINAQKVIELSEAQESFNDLSAQLAQERSDRTDESATIAALQTDLARQKAANLTLSDTLSAMAAQTEAQGGLIRTTITDLSDAVARERETTEALEESVGRGLRLRNQVARLAEQLQAMEADLEETAIENERLDTIIANSGIGMPNEVPTPQPIDGSITRIDEIGGGITLVEINVGTRDDVAEGMSFTVSRGDEYVGVITIQTVDTANAVGQLVRNSSDLRAGDRVAAGR